MQQNKRKKLVIMIGPAGSGKTTWVQEHASAGCSAHISRDTIRFNMLSDNENYFAHEKEVRKEFIQEIHDALYAPWVTEVFADATHLTAKARANLLVDIDCFWPSLNIIAVVVKPKLEVALQRNSQREGLALVPEKAILNMYNQYEDPKDDPIKYKEIIYINE